jgi:hypothetical protein
MGSSIETNGLRGSESRKVTHTRLTNPLSEPLEGSTSSFSRFQQVVNDIAGSEGGVEIKHPEREEMRSDPSRPLIFNIIEIPFEDLEEEQVSSIKTITISAFDFPEIKIKRLFQLPIRTYERKHPLMHKLTKPMLTHYIGSSFATNEDTNLEPGVFLQEERLSPLLGTFAVQKKRKKDHLPQHGTLRIQDQMFNSEAEIAYLAVVSSLVLAKRLDLSTPEKMRESIPYRRSLFLQIYKEFLSDMEPSVKRDEMVGLDNQIADIDTNLLKPLLEGRGTPMHSLLVGAPGVGKSFLVRHLAFKSDLLVVPMNVGALSNNFESVKLNTLLYSLRRIKEKLELPVIVAIDDIEAILEVGLTENPDQSTSRSVDTEKRSRALTFLERLMDTYEIYLMGTLNHPDVEAAFLRRFNPIYFPLPNIEQRRQHLLKVLRGRCDDDVTISELAGKTDGFNYSGIDSISGYARNADGVYANTREALLYAVSKARQRTDVNSLRNFDEAARQMVGEKTKRSVGFKT